MQVCTYFEEEKQSTFEIWDSGMEYPTEKSLSAEFQHIEKSLSTEYKMRPASKVGSITQRKPTKRDAIFHNET